MTRLIQCQKLGKEAEGLDFPPYPGDLGKKIYTSISKEGWALWQSQQTMLINEYRLNMLDAESRKFLQEEMEKFLFGGGSDRPPGYVEPEDN